MTLNPLIEKPAFFKRVEPSSLCPRFAAWGELIDLIRAIRIGRRTVRRLDRRVAKAQSSLS